MVPFRLVEFGLLLVGEGLFILPNGGWGGGSLSARQLLLNIRQSQDPVRHRAMADFTQLDRSPTRARVRTPYLGPVEDVLYRQHGHDGQHFLTAAQVHRHDQHFAQHWFQGEFCHLVGEGETTVSSLCKTHMDLPVQDTGQSGQ